ncbi:Aromatic hydrocarbon degradation protein [Vibrio chagasii]|uniref:outer membrane protein transport protein n=1 Tax=Vibrio chagasii TaxID=170679 RepID=UPI0016410863|nr:outer membrane protein transport protein [Vibrio chagasii]CAH6939392.1 Aromatic hydrocarbon degradation protein [Vibrio chagasii]CAH7030723.1 Aromatic hydrocarbon degradation protein [Vibrio chagasii]CAH7139624.1 Aromatic hydrocarbon degradation protein [Vibrio chagasii]CAH7213715.1 Aromatic hydrocarbon degradation protein [Vibrio chagasii]CAH7314923.1 Aromatic hydrocarbon degradation protein [Vibrio chagasii]
MKNKLLLGTAAALVPCLTNAAGFQLNAQSATGLGRAFAGDAVMADSAAIVAKNSAAMAYIEQPMVSVGAIYIDSGIDVSNVNYTPMIGNTETLDDQSLDAGTLVPNLHYVHPIQGSKFTLGATVHSNFGTDVEFDDSFEADEFGGKTALSSINVGLAVAYELSEKINLGAGLDVIYGEGEIHRKNLLDVDADGFGLGANIGATYQVNENNRFGITYRYSPDIEVEGDITKGGVPADKMNVPLPDTLEFSGWHQLNEQWAFHYSLQWVNWSEFDSLTSDSYDDSIKEYQWKDAGHVSVGGTYTMSKDVVLRAGYMYDISPTDELTSLSIPDVNRHWVTVGGTYHFTDDNSVDVGIGFIIGESQNIDESLTTIPGTSSNITADVSADAVLLGVQYQHRF